MRECGGSEESRMGAWKPVNRELNVIAAICLVLVAGNRGFAHAAQPQAAQQPSAQTAAARPVGTIKSISGNTDRKSTRLNSSHLVISYAVFCLKKKKKV